MQRTFTDRTASTAKPGAKPRKIFDAGRDSVAGLHLLVRPNGSKLWRMRFWLHGRERLLALGSYTDGMGLAAAREAARAAKRAVADGIDPVAQRRTEAAERARASASTFASVAQTWLAEGRWVPVVRAGYATYLTRDILPVLGTTAVTDIRRADVIALVKRMERQRKGVDGRGRPVRVGGTVAARRVRMIVQAVLGEALQQDLVDHNVAADVPVPGARKGDAAHRPTPIRHFGLADDCKLRDFLLALDAYGGEPATIAAIRLQVLLFVRPTELRLARWDEIGVGVDGGPVLTIARERMKMRREPHVVPLARQALETIEGLRPLTGDSPYLFPHRSDRTRPIGSSTVLRALQALGSDASPHGFRHTASTRLHELGFDSLAIEAALAHRDRNAIRARYNMSGFETARRRMMQAWADWLDDLKAGRKPAASNVIPLRAASAE